MGRNANRLIAAQPVNDQVIPDKMDAVVDLDQTVPVAQPALDKGVALPLEREIRVTAIIPYFDGLRAVEL